MPSRNRQQTLIIILALVALVGSAAALYLWRAQRSAVVQITMAEAHANRAEQNFKASKAAIDAILADLADRLASLKGIRSEAIEPLLTGVETAMGALAASTHNNADVRRSQAAMYIELSATYLAFGNTGLAVASARKGSDIFRALAAADPNNDDIHSNVGLSLQRLGEALRASGNVKDALVADRQSLEIARVLASKEPNNGQFQIDVVLALWRLASAGDDPRRRLTEALKILKNLKLAAMLTPSQEEWIGAIEDGLSRMP